MRFFGSKMRAIKRERCVISDEKDLEKLYSFKNFPVFMGCVDEDEEDDLKMDMDFFISKSTGSVQLDPLVPLDILYRSSHGSGSVGSSWINHHEALSEFVLKFGCKNVFEIGGGHGILARKYVDKNKDAKWSILEANPTPKYSHERISFVKGIFV